MEAGAVASWAVTRRTVAVAAGLTFAIGLAVGHIVG